MTIEDRLKKVELELAWARRSSRQILAAIVLTVGALALGLAVSTGPGVAHGEAAKSVRASAFIVEDEAGRTRATLEMYTDPILHSVTPALHLFDEKGEVRAALRILLGRPVLSLYDKAGNSRLTLEDGLLAIIDKAGNVRVKLEEFKGETSLYLFDEAGLGLELGPESVCDGITSGVRNPQNP